MAKHQIRTAIAKVLALGGGIWGLSLSLMVLTNLRWDALPFMLLLLVVHGLVIATGLWPSGEIKWRAGVWLGMGGILFYLVYLSRFSLGIYLLPSPSLIVLAGIVGLSNHFVGTVHEKQVGAPTLVEPPHPTPVPIEQSQEINLHVQDLTSRELEVLILIAQGKSNQEIAAKLVISVNTVRHHVHQLLQKLGCASRREAAQIAERAGLHSPTKATTGNHLD